MDNLLFSSKNENMQLCIENLSIVLNLMNGFEGY